MFLALIFVLVFVDISSVPTQKPDAAGATSSAAGVGADGKTAGVAGGGNPTIAEKFTSKINQLTAAPGYRRENLPRNVTGLYHGDWSSPNHKFQSGILPARPSTKPKTTQVKDNTAATRALQPAAGRMLLTLRSTAVRIMFYVLPSFLSCLWRSLCLSYPSIAACLHSPTPHDTSLTIIPPPSIYHSCFYNTDTGPARHHVRVWHRAPVCRRHWRY
jgi:hypothetical protein